jgi:hypothetical protein
MSKITSYNKHPQSVCGEDGSKFNNVLNTAYDNVEFTLATGQTDYDVKTNVAGAFSNVATARNINIRTDVTITIKFNATTNTSITITSSDSPLKVDTLEITNIYISNASGSNANIKILLT